MIGNQEHKLHEFEQEHGPALWNGSWGLFRDGCECEFTPLDIRFLVDRPPEQKEAVKRRYWQGLVKVLSRDFRTLHAKCEDAAMFGLVREQDVMRLRELQQQVQEAAEQLDRLENPPGPDAAEVRKAIKFYRQLRQLAWDTKEAEKDYHDHPTNRLGKRWQERWDLWDQANQRYQRIDAEVRRAAESQVADEDRRAKIELQQHEIEMIEI